MISEDVAMIRVSGQDQKDEEGLGMLGSLFGKLKDMKDAQVINAPEYKM